MFLQTEAHSRLSTVDHAGGHQEKLALVEAETGKVRKLLNCEKTAWGVIRYTPDGKALVYGYPRERRRQPVAAASGWFRRERRSRHSIGTDPRLPLVTGRQTARHRARAYRLRRGADARHAAVKNNPFTTEDTEEHREEHFGKLSALRGERLFRF